MNRLLTLAASLSLIAQFAFGSLPANAQSLVPIFTSQYYISPNTKEQHFESMLYLQPGQEMMPLKLVVDNGPNGKVPFNWFRINIAGYLMASEQDLHGTRQAVVDVSGRMQAGQSQVLIDCAGEPGATLVWQLYTTPTSLKSVEPTSVQAGGTVVLHGTNFSTDETQDKVLINGSPAQVLSASATSITARVPANVNGNATVQAIINGKETQKLAISVSQVPIPVLYSMNYWMAPPGAVLTIAGDNFDPNMANNRVFFKNVSAQVVSASKTRLQVIIPNWGYGSGQLNIPVWVIADGRRSGNYLPFDIGPKYEGALPPSPNSEAISESSSQSSSEASPWPMDATSESSTQSGSEASFQGQQASEAPFTSEQGSEASVESGFPLILP
jgi:hypothetical protein